MCVDGWVCVYVRERKKERMTERTSKKCGATRARSLLRKKAGLNKRKKN